MPPYSSITFKARSPEQTIAYAGSVLAELGLSVKECQWCCNPAALSVRLNIVELQFGVNGKGITKKYALASAYGELLERIQNISIFNSVFRSGNAVNIALKYPDQKELSYSPSDLGRIYLRNMFPDRGCKIAFSQQGPCASIPFYNVSRNETVYLPERILRDAIGTNGMCAGNTAAEAIIQGLCEIFERYVLRKILCDGEEPPEIPLDYVSPAIIERYVIPMEKLGYQVYLKDCTLNGRFPVVGTFVRKSNKGLFHLGSAPDMEIALERCFTELLQGETTTGLKNALQPIIFESRVKSGHFWQQEFCRAFRDYKSAQKISMFRNMKKMDKENIFESNDLTSLKTLKSLLRRVENQNYDLLIRDNTFLGFPAFQIVVPGISELRLLDGSLLNIHDRVHRARHIFFNLDTAKIEDLKFLVDVINELSLTKTVEKMEIMEIIHNIPAHRNSALSYLDYRWFAGIIHFHIGNYSDAERLLASLIVDMETLLSKVPKYFYCMWDILKLRIEDLPWKDINTITSNSYNEEDLVYAYFPLEKIENVIRYFNIPKCENCKDCDYSDCNAKTLSHYAGMFQSRINANMKQNTIRELFLELKRNKYQSWTLSTGD